MTRRRDRAFGARHSPAGGPTPITLSGDGFPVLEPGRGPTNPHVSRQDTADRVMMGPVGTGRGATGWGATRWGVTGSDATRSNAAQRDPIGPGVSSIGVTGSAIMGPRATGQYRTNSDATVQRSVWSVMRARRSRWVLSWAALASLVLHAGVLAAFLILADRTARGLQEAIDAVPKVELVMVEQKGQDKTAAQAPPQPDPVAKTIPPVAPPPTPPPALRQPPVPAVGSPPPPPAPPPSTTEADAVALPPPPPPAPPPPAQPPAVPRPTVPAATASPATVPSPRPETTTREAPPHPPSPAQVAAPQAAPSPPAPVTASVPRVNLGGTDDLSNVLVTGDNVIPVGPDPKARNREPEYPNEAVRRGEQGLVELLVHVTSEGLPSQVDIARSSGFQLLDRTARDAVASWRFVPAVRDGQPIPSSASVRIVFQLD